MHEVVQIQSYRTITNKCEKFCDCRLLQLVKGALLLDRQLLAAGALARVACFFEENDK